MNDVDWRQNFPGAGHARNLAERLAERLEELETGNVEAVKRKLAGTRWRGRQDLNGIPNDVVDAADDLVDEAREHLVAGERSETKSKLIEARSLFTGQE